MSGTEALVAQLSEEFGLTPVVGLEIEWYIRPKEWSAPFEPAAQERDGYLDALCIAADAARLKLDSFDEEHGPGQFEAALHHSSDIPELIEQAKKLIEVVKDVGFRRGYVSDFSAKPYPSVYGNGLHVHLHLENKEGENVFRKQEDDLSSELESVLAGLLADMPRATTVFAPQEQSWERFEAGWHAPVKICWGTNNRTTALRLPDHTAKVSGADALARLKNPDSRRIEHRVAGSDADPEAVIGAILEGVLLGLRERPPLSAPVFGDAGKDQYDYPAIKKEAS